jgi:hypothetical protein
VTHVRKGHLIYTAAGALWKDCKTINAAKRESRDMQKSGSVIKAEEVKRAKPKVFASRAEGRRYQQSKPRPAVRDSNNERDAIAQVAALKKWGIAD